MVQNVSVAQAVIASSLDFTAERTGDRRGFIVAVDWAARPDSNTGGTWIAGGGWSWVLSDMKSLLETGRSFDQYGTGAVDR